MVKMIYKCKKKKNRRYKDSREEKPTALNFSEGGGFSGIKGGEGGEREGESSSFSSTSSF